MTSGPRVGSRPRSTIRAKEVPAMRILLAIDGSAPAGRALELVDHLAWPAGTSIRVVAALEHGSDLIGMPNIPPAHAGAANAAPSSLDAARSDRRDIEASLVRRLDDA